MARSDLKGSARFTLQKFAEAIVPKDEAPPQKLLDRISKIIANSSLLFKFFFRSAIYLIEWGSFFFYGFERFSQLKKDTRRRYIRLWMKHKIWLPVRIVNLLRLLVLTSFFDITGNPYDKK